MANMDILKKKLAELQNQSKKGSLIWKPKSGKTTIRIVPYKYSEGDFPFIELLFHYNIGNKTYLSPASFGEPDPFIEFAKKLKESGDKESYTLAKKLEPRPRTYVPIVVRGQESEGTKFWGFGKTVYQDLLNVMVDEDYGDITNPSTGRDIVVTFKTAEEIGKNFPETKIVVKPNTSSLTTDKHIAENIANTQLPITDMFKSWTYDELKEILTKWLSGESVDDNSSTSDDESDGDSDTYTDEAPAKKSTSTSDSTTSMNVASSPEEITAKFNSLFNKPGV